MLCERYLFVNLFDGGMIGLGELVGRDGAFQAVVHERKATIAKVAQVGQQLGIVLGGHIIPGEERIRGFGAARQQIVTPHFLRDVCTLRAVSENSCFPALRKLVLS